VLVFASMQKDRDSTLATLAWLVENGADEAIEDTPQNRLAKPPKTPSHAPPAAPIATSEPRPAEPPPSVSQTSLWQPEEGTGLTSSDAAVSSSDPGTRKLKTIVSSIVIAGISSMTGNAFAVIRILEALGVGVVIE